MRGARGGPVPVSNAKRGQETPKGVQARANGTSARRSLEVEQGDPSTQPLSISHHALLGGASDRRKGCPSEQDH